MQARGGFTSPWLLIGTFSVLVPASALLAQRTSLLFGFVAATIAAGALLAAIHRRCTLDWRLVLAGAFLLRASVFWLPPSLSDDFYRYVWDGRVQQEGANPYLFRPSDQDLQGLQSTDLFERLNSVDVYTVYPPLSQEVFFFGTVFSTDWRTQYYIIKLIILFIEAAGLIALMRLAAPDLAVLYAWNPVVIIEVAGQGHTEGMAAGLLLLALLLAKGSRYGGSSAAVAAAGMVKLTPFLLLPLLSRRGRWIALLASLLAALLMAAPYLRAGVVENVLQSLTLYVQYFEFNAGPYYAVKGVVQLLTGHDPSKTLGPLFALVFLVSLPAIYWADRRFRRTLAASFVAVLSTFLLLSTTVHPWYVVPLLAVVAVERPVRWHWYWFSILSAGTYLLYVGGPYWTFVVLAWAVWALLAAQFHFDSVLQWLQRRRGAAKFRSIADWITTDEPVSILDLGAGEGYVGLAASNQIGASVLLADIIDMNRTSLPFRRVGDSRLGFESDSFDYVILFYVLHHASNPDRLLLESARLARRGVIVVESVFEGNLQRRVLIFLDRLANRIRSRGLMRDQEEHLHFRTMRQWSEFINGLGLTVRRERSGGHWIHTKAWMFVHD